MVDNKALRPCVLELGDISGFTDYFVICSTSSPRQMKAIAEGIQQQLKSCGVRMEHQEGRWDSAWVLLDYGELIVHIFSEETRLFYNLEQLWHTAGRLEF